MWRFITRVLLLIASASTFAQNSIHILDLRHRPAHEVVPIVQPMLRPGESVSGTGYQLFLNTSTSRRAEIEKVIRALDVAQRQLTITVRQATHRDNEETRIGVDGTIVIGKNADADIRIRGRQQETKAERQNTQTLRVLDGQRAFIRTGQSIPSIQRILQLTGRGDVVVQERLQVHNFTTGFDVLPRVRGETVLLEITPRLTEPSNSHPERFRFQELSTTVTTSFGQWVDLGSIATSGSEVSREILGAGNTRTDQRISIYVKVD